jgi:hypothetical protein
MATQKSLFDNRPYRGSLPSSAAITPPAADQTVHATLPAYHAFLSAASNSQYTPDDFTAGLIGGWSRSREIFGPCGQAAGAGYPGCGAAFGVRAGLGWGWMVAGCP